MKKRILPLVMVVILVLVSAGCQTADQTTGDQTTGSSAETTSATSGATQSSETTEGKLPDAEFTYFIPDPNAKIIPDDSPVMKQIYDLTGVRIKRVIPPAEPLERLNIMLATGEMPDLISFQDATVMRQYIDAGKIMRLNELIAENCPDVLSVNWAEFKNRLADEQGNLYYMPQGYTIGGVENAAPETDNGLNVRTALFEEMGYDKLPNTLDEYKALLAEVKQKYPQMTPISLALGAQGHLSQLISYVAGAYGLEEDSGLVRSDGKLIHFSQSPEIKEYFAFLNDLNTEGYLDIEAPVLSAETLKQKCVAGKVWSYFGPGWEINSEMIAYESDNGSNEQMITLFPKANDSVTKVTYSRGPRNLYNTGLTITSMCADPDRFMKFYDYANTEQGRFNMLGTVNWEFTGENTIEATKDYNFVAQLDNEIIPGRPTVIFTAWTGDMWAKDENWWWNWGVECMYDFTYGGGNYPGGKYDAVGDEDVGMWLDENTTRIWNARGWTGLTYWDIMRDMYIDTAEFSNLELDPASDEYASKLSIQRVWEKMLPRAIMAESAAAFESEWSAMLDEFEKEGLQSYMAKSNELYNKRMEIWGAK